MYIHEESGAVTVDWVVLTAGLVGLGLASMAVVSAGVQDTSTDVKNQLDNTPIFSAFSTTSSDDFESGAGDWIGASVVNRTGFGNIFGNIGGADSDGTEQMYVSYDLADHDGPVQLEFDMLALNSWNTDEGIIYIDGQEVARVNVNHTGQAGSQGGSVTWTMADVEGVTVEANTTSINSDIDGHSSLAPDGSPRLWNDTTMAVTITVDDPSANMTLGFGADMNESLDNESLAIDNVNMTKIHNGLGG